MVGTMDVQPIELAIKLHYQGGRDITVPEYTLASENMHNGNTNHVELTFYS